MLFLSSAGESFLQLLFAFVMFVGVLAITYYVTKWIAGYQKIQGFNKNLEIVEAIKISSNKYVQIIRAGQDRYFLIAIGKDEVVPLGEISSDQLKEISSGDTHEAVTPVDFKSVLDKFSKKK
ncbi:MAG: flagellar biosynthetic protein FliO [Pseudobutyrivibrio sp.]|nr:flagellar biosynthetic protein FliO [Pseudobutyrivibrio sp.]